MQVLRPADLEERRCICRDVLGLYGAIVSVAIYTPPEPESEALLKDRIIQALKLCVIRHPALSTVILDAEGNKPMLARPESINLDDHLRFQQAAKDSSDTTLWVEQIENDPFAELHLHPPWKVHVRPLTAEPGAFQVAFGMSHSLGDGRSCYLFHSAFLQALQQVTHSMDSEASSILSLASSEPLPPALESLVKMPISWSFLLGPFFKEYSPRFLTRLFVKPEDIWAGSNIRPARPRAPQLLRTQLKSLYIHQETLKTATLACRAHSVKLTAYINHLTARALAQVLQTHGQEHVNFIADTALDLRRLVPQHAGSMGNFVSSLAEFIALPPEALDPNSPMTESEWAAIRIGTERLAHAAVSQADQPVALLRYLDDFWRWTKAGAAKPASTSINVSNIGIFDPGEQTDGWQIRDMLFSQSADGTGAPINLNVASTKGGTLAIVISWWPGMLGVANEGLFVADVLARLEAMLTSA